MYQSGKYFHAQAMYEKAYKKEKDKEKKADIAFKNADCFDRINEARKASSWYRKALMNRDTFADAALHLAYSEVKNNRLEEAKENFWEYNDLRPKAKDESTILERIEKWEEYPGRYKVEILKKFNSAGSDFAPVYMGQDTNVIFFTSTRKLSDKPRKDGVTGDRYSNIFESHYSNEVVRKSRKKRGRKNKSRKVITDTYQWSKPDGVGDTLNSDWNDGAACFSSDGATLFFTSSRKINKNHQGTKIFAVQRNDGQWGRAELIQVVPDSLSVAHPSISEDGSILYFVSDMPGGYGGNDIWMVKKSGSGWSEPQNLGRPINSTDNELFPHIRDNGALYFASDRKEGMGGLDIYKAEKSPEGVWKVDNMKYPINSTADDFAIHFQYQQEKGMFASSRKKGGDDIYRFDYVPLQFSFLGKVINAETKEPVETARVHVVSTDGEQKNDIVSETGDFLLQLEPELEYIVMVLAKGYLNGKKQLSTLGLNVSRNFKSVIELKPIEKPIELPNIFYDFGSWELREASQTALNALVETLNDNPKVTIELGSHTDFVGSDKTNQALSQKRAQSVVDYLIEKGIYWDRLIAHGYGEAEPRQINKEIAEQYDFLNEKDVLTEKMIAKLNSEQKEIANQLNRRTEFKVLSTNYKPGPNSKIKPGADANQLGNTLIKDLNKVKGVFYTIQLGAYSNKTLPTVIQDFKVVFRAPIDSKTNRFTTGIFDDLKEAQTELKNINRSGIKAFVIAYYNGKKITFAEAKKMKE
jgi:peptidoglycan-associated lipoprotein